MLRWFMCLALAVIGPALTHAQDRSRHYSQCQAIAEVLPGAQFARMETAGMHGKLLRVAAAADTVNIRYIGHSTFYLETPGGVTIATDYNGYVRPPIPPMIATMNRAHSTHYTLLPEPGIEHVLHGWSDDPTQKAAHNLVVRDTLVRNVTTDIRSGGGVQLDGNSVFIFEVAGLCIGHLGHLHQELSAGQYAEIGRLDVVMVPVDGGLTMGADAMSRVVQRLRSSLILPMHRPGGLVRFLSMFGPDYEIRMADTDEVVVSLESLPRKPVILIPRGMQ